MSTRAEKIVLRLRTKKRRARLGQRTGSGSAPRRFLVRRRSTIFSARVDIAALVCSCARSPLPGCSQARRQL